MVQWYYVDGTERVGPVSIMEIENLINSQKLHDESYVWRKGFPNWEKIKNVEELKTENKDKLELAPIIFKEIHSNEELFFVRTGKDREEISAKIFGPYSLTEIEHAFKNKRINSKTFIFAAGMDEWKEIGELDFFISMLGITEKEVSLKSIKQAFFYAKFQNEKMAMLVKSFNGASFVLQSKVLDQMLTDANVDVYIGTKKIAEGLKIVFSKSDKFEQAYYATLDNVEKDLLEQLEKVNNE